ncbi:glycosyltransferase family 2 protein (plasmid) [Rhizobium phaseoli]|uniref:Glycosyltransferase family 2 protein n=1 Tax=Rhizobium phaseoli TaxID=396 RepID=A0ABN4QZE1_9HYPH|nr:glycosyltransferase [Rhizobium phaseoli]KEC70351.1 glycosyltransferase [Rhizobium leguminosarum bv. phaseoli CCGM1]ANL31301.1 glycosyltransferase family 2 protein [Rhizobium phaseoli]ANL56753.1 glycosyltransferase family 2 protein [Rhizobium phaseoli]ANL69249.1 glycosyltransferase family 2 protein [Rhizobium phaseoli]ANL82048.1 glycosyltransferase family 2 protein [Rhizobium phaseoli]
MERPALSVLINNYNYARFVGRAIDSVLSQDARNVEIIVVDDGSTDQSRSVLQAYDSRVKVIFQENAGQAAAINTAVGSSMGEILCFLDADDWWAPGKLSATAAAFRANPQASLVYHRLQPTLVDGTPTSKPIPRTLCSGALSSLLARSAGWWPFPMTSAVAVRRSAWDAAGSIPLDFRISADAWLVGIYPFLGDVIAMPDPLGFYRIHNNNWYRAAEDAATLRRRMTHWQQTVEATNLFLSTHELPARLHLRDHYPYRVASAKLQGADALTRFKLAIEGLFFAGEPNLLRRTRDSLRSARGLSRLGLDVGLPEVAK